MSLQFILGGSGAGKTHYLYETMIQESMVNSDTKYLILVPEQFTLQTQKDLVTMHPNHGIMNIDILSFLRLSFRIFDEVGGNHRLVLEDTGKSMIVKKIAMEKRNELVMFGANVKKQGFIDEMKSIISELLQYSIHTPELDKMKQIAGERRLLSNKLKDIITIYDAYEEFLKDRYISAEEVLDVLCDVIDDSKIIEGSVICLDGFTGFTPSQYNLIAHLLRKAAKVYVTVTLDERLENRPVKEHELFHLSYKTIEKLTTLADENRVEVLPNIFPEKCGQTLYRYKNSKALAHLEHNIFRYPYKIFQEEQQDITITAAKNAKEEVKCAAIEIQRLLREEGYRYKDIAIVTGDVEGYSEPIKLELGRLDIPCFIDQKKNILTNPLVELIRASIELVEHNFSYEAVIRFLKCKLIHVDKEALYLLDNYVIAQGIRGFSMYQKEWNRNYKTKYSIDFERINSLRQKFVDEVTKLYEVLNQKEAPVKEKITAIYELLVNYRCEEQLDVFAQELKAKATDEDMQRAKEYEQVFRLVLDIFDRIVELLGADILSLREFKDILETGLKEAKVGLIPPGVDQILVGDIERTRLKDIKALFFVGVNDGIVPKANPGGGILSDMERQLFADHAIELSPTKRQNAYTTEFYLYLNLTKPQNRLYLSFAKLDGSGKSMRTSYLISKIQKLFPNLITKNADSKGISEDEKLNRALSTDYGFEYLVASLREFEESTQDDLFYELYQLYLNEQLPAKLSFSEVMEGVFYRNKETGLSAHVAKKLYSESLIGSVTRMERYAACAFAHFLEYGLGLEERKEYKVSVPDIGNIFHEALELFSKKLKDSEYSWHNLPKDVEVTFGRESVEEAVQDFENGILESSKRNAYLIKRVERILLKTVETLTKQLKAGRFEPLFYEQFFSHADRYLKLHGRIDRVDVYEEEGKLYLKVIDYKSGSTSFDLMSLYYGLQLQLGVYLTAATQLMKEEHPDKEVIPAGVFYYNLDDPIVEKSDHVEEEVDKKLRMNGLAIADKSIVPMMDLNFLSPDGALTPSIKSSVIPVETSKDGEFTKRSSVATKQQFELLQTYITDLLHEFSVQIMDGRVLHNPFKNKNKEACTHCKFSAVCGFDCKIDGYRYRKLKPLTGDEVWQLIDEKGDEEDGEHVVDTTTEESN